MTSEYDLPEILSQPIFICNIAQKLLIYLLSSVLNMLCSFIGNNKNIPEILINAGADVNIVNENEDTPLHLVGTFNFHFS